MDHDFLEGIDEHFERLMRQHGNGRRNGSRASRVPSDRVILEILDQLEELSSTQRQEVLAYVQKLKGDAQRS